MLAPHEPDQSVNRFAGVGPGERADVAVALFFEPFGRPLPAFGGVTEVDSDVFCAR